MEYRILGPVEVVTAAGPLVLGGPKQRALLGVLLLNPGRAVSTDRLAAALWGDEPPETAVNILQGHVGDLRRLLDRDALLTRPPGYLLQAEDGQIDAGRFERLACEGRRLLASQPATAAARLREALALWRGPVLSDIAYPRVPAEITRLEELRLATLEDRVDADLALGAHADLAAELAALRLIHPGRERLCGQLMLALYRAGRQEEALAACQELRHRLREDLGIDPSPELQRLERSILRQDPSLLLPSPAAAAAPPAAVVAPAPAQGPPPAAPAAPQATARPRWPQRTPLLAAAAVMLVGGSSVGLLRARTGTPPPAPPPSSSSPCLHATPAPRPRPLGPGQGVLATVAHSCGGDAPPGLWRHSGPAGDMPHVGDVAYDEG
ncbi:MAG TPA: AfsR/SARP family transcriptional regulator, partial [Candidatus Dormibacteraeota bacterium]|nr:AfsR/SARP family transcriptional regulator [Candidatus Dormibacteraeota bacterium]